ncbi:ATP-binding protein [Azospirillum oryzae]|uniref:ATP-binding protein n=1 Tax=Azospirillum oryzae TaxID=286727 RepID=A0A6N1AK61_9PROT|nr:AAA family ATPase [Azospirillum oryzae]QKS51729.1 ATP-binding protein [Azospirillum oryzae]
MFDRLALIRSYTGKPQGCISRYTAPLQDRLFVALILYNGKLQNIIPSSAYRRDGCERHQVCLFQNFELLGVQMSVMAPIGIRSIEANKLFGYYTYQLPGEDEDKDLSNFFILYGDNGSGKTTILRLVHNLLVPESMPGARSYIGRTAFQSICVKLSDGSKVSAIRAEGNITGNYDIVIERPESDSRVFPMVLDPNTQTVTVGVEPVIEALKEFNVYMYFLSDDRRTVDPYIKKGADANYIWIRDEHGKIVDRVPRPNGESSHHLDIEPMLARVSSTARRNALKGSNRGEEDAATIYKQVVARISTPETYTDGEKTETSQKLIERIKEIGNITQKFAEYGLTSSFPADDFLEMINSAKVNDRNLIGRILQPYVEGVEARVRALQLVYDMMNRFVSNANFLLHPKKATFTLADGIRILDVRGKPIKSNNLSSGEKQLLLVFCHSVLVRKAGSIFIIDEPELSLNIKWQRELLTRMSAVAGDAAVQFVLATHSLDVLALHRSSTVYLENLNNEQEDNGLRDEESEDDGGEDDEEPLQAS